MTPSYARRPVVMPRQRRASTLRDWRTVVLALADGLRVDMATTARLDAEGASEWRPDADGLRRLLHSAARRLAAMRILRRSRWGG